MSENYKIKLSFTLLWVLNLGIVWTTFGYLADAVIQSVLQMSKSHKKEARLTRGPTNTKFLKLLEK